MKRLEYKIISVDYIGDSIDAIELKFNESRKEGWELVTIVTHSFNIDGCHI